MPIRSGARDVAGQRGESGLAQDGRVPTIDRDRWANLAEFDRYEAGTVARLVELFAAGAPARVDALEDAVAAGDLTEVERRAHALRGSAGNLGAFALADVLAIIERDAAGGRAPRTTAVARVRRLAEEAVVEARRLLG